MKKRRVGLLLAAMLFGLLLLPNRGYAACTHNWDLYEIGEWESISDTQCAMESKWKCTLCGAEKTETDKQNHPWEVLTMYYPYTNEECWKIQFNYCPDCGADTIDTNMKVISKGKHNYDDNGKCTNCDNQLSLSKQLTWKAKTSVWAGKNTWLKVTTSKDGYITLTQNQTRKTETTTSFGVYNSSKKLYKYMSGVKLGQGSSGSYMLPLKKGTYYIKFNYLTHASYTFTAASSSKNYNQDKAITLKKNKTVTGIVFTKGSKINEAKYGNWYRYYKIKITKPQYLKIYFQSSGLATGYPSYVWSDDADSSNFKATSYGWITCEKLKKGTYYLGIGNADSTQWKKSNLSKGTGSVWKLRWK